ncbi:MAG: DUF6602 domain-containing protein [Vulcanibacillus sp.]
MLNLVLSKDVSVSEGFVITSNDEVSTQCDVIIYNSNLSPLVENDIAKIFPIEEVKGIGEIKSDLNKKDFSSALIKLANNKKLQDHRKGSEINAQVEVLPQDDIVSFLICNKLKGFNLDNIDFEGVYCDIPRNYWHNAILSLEDGEFAYIYDFKKIEEKVRKPLYEFIGEKVLTKLEIPYPYYLLSHDIIKWDVNFLEVSNETPYLHIHAFLSSINMAIKRVNTYEHDRVKYLGLNPDDIYE